MKLLELLREYATACEAEDKTLAVLGNSLLIGETAGEGPSMTARADHAKAERALEAARAAFEDEMNDLVDRRVQAALANLRSDAWH